MALSAANLAFIYYFRAVISNRIRSLVGKIKQPRYLIGVGLIGLYFFYLYKRVGFTSPYFLIVIYFVQILIAWLSLPFSDGTRAGRALAFSQAEVDQLFCMPLDRHQLLQFKLIQNQWGSLFVTLIFTFLARHIEGVSIIRLVPGLWLMSNIFNLHGTLMNVAAAYLQRTGRQYLGWLFSGAVVLAIGAAIWQATGQAETATGNILDFFKMPAFAMVLKPVSLLLAPALSSSAAGFFQALWIPVAVLGIHLLIYFTAPFPFEDNAIVTAERLANLRRHGLSALRRKESLTIKQNRRSRLQRLAPAGPQWRAVLWKNWISVGRVSPGLFRRLLLYILLALLAASFLPQPVQLAFGMILAFAALYLILLGPALLRVDLRIDIPHFDMIKSMPIHGRQLIFGSIMAPHLIIFGLQAASLIGAALLINRLKYTLLTAIDKIEILCIALPAIFALTFFFFTLQNLMALYLPSFTRFGRNAQRGFDQMGQNMLGLIVRLLSLIVALIPVAVVAGIIGVVGIKLLHVDQRITIVADAVLGSIILFVETVLLIYLSDSRYRRFDISAENIAVEE